jgi:DNA-damage-inducible protein J
MATENVSFELNTKTYDELEEVCEKLGMTTDEAFSLFARKMVNEQAVPFEVTKADLEDEHAPVKKVLCIALVISSVAAALALLKVLFSHHKCPFHK